MVRRLLEDNFLYVNFMMMKRIVKIVKFLNWIFLCLRVLMVVIDI